METMFTKLSLAIENLEARMNKDKGGTIVHPILDVNPHKRIHNLVGIMRRVIKENTREVMDKIVTSTP